MLSNVPCSCKCACNLQKLLCASMLALAQAFESAKCYVAGHSHIALCICLLFCVDFVAHVATWLVHNKHLATLHQQWVSTAGIDCGQHRVNCILQLLRAECDQESERGGQGSHRCLSHAAHLAVLHTNWLGTVPWPTGKVRRMACAFQSATP